jgi:hypothetical protein
VGEIGWRLAEGERGNLLFRRLSGSAAEGLGLVTVLGAPGRPRSKGRGPGAAHDAR